MYVAVKGGEKAISAAHELLRREGRGDPSVPDLGIEQLIGQLRLAVDRVMAEGSLYDRDLAALAIKQAQGDLLEAVFLVRAYRTTLPRFGSSLAVDTSAMRVLRRISATWKDLPGGQILGATFDYTHRLLDRTLSRAEAGAAGSSPLPAEPDTDSPLGGPLPRALDALVAEGLLERPEPSEGDACRDITRHPLELPADAPADRGVRLQALARADEGFLLGMAYSTQRGFGAVHPFTGELRRGWVEVSFFSEELGFDVVIGEIELTECETVSRYTGTARPPCFTRGYGLVFGNNERKALSMSNWTNPSSARRRIPNSCSCTATTWTPRVLSSTSSCRITWTFRPIFPLSAACAPSGRTTRISRCHRPTFARTRRLRAMRSPILTKRPNA